MYNIRKMKILITGGAGFIGSEFTRQVVRRGYRPVVVDSLTYAGDLQRLREVEGEIIFYRVSISNREELEEVFKRERPEVVVHFAAESHVDRSILNPSAFLETNIMGTFNLLELSKDSGVERFINISTDEVYGDLTEEGFFTEESPLKPNSPYSASKASQDMLGRSYWKTYGLQVITVRPSNNYGPWQYPEKLIPVVIFKALNNERIPVYGEGKNIREWLYVSDCAEAILQIMERAKGGDIFNVGSGMERRNIEIVRDILGILNKSEDLIEFVKDRPGHDFRYAMKSERIKRDIGWQAKTDLQTGLERTVRWYIDHRDWLEQKVKDLREFWAKVYG